MVDEARQVADAVAGRVGEAAWVDLVDDAALPPVLAERRADDRRRTPDGGRAVDGRRIRERRFRERVDGQEAARLQKRGEGPTPRQDVHRGRDGPSIYCPTMVSERRSGAARV